MNDLKQRHGCVTFWLWLITLMNLGMALYYSVLMFEANASKILGFGLLSFLCVVNVLGGILLMRWNKLGFYMLLVTSIVAVMVNVGLFGLPSTTILSSLFAVLIWWAILQIRKNGVSAWKQMNGGWDYKHCRHLYQVFVGIIVFVFILTIIAVSSKHEGNPNEKIIDDNYNVELEDTVGESVLANDSVEWILEDSTVSVDEEFLAE